MSRFLISLVAVLTGFAAGASSPDSEARPLPESPVIAVDSTLIMGHAAVDADAMYRFVYSRNPNFTPDIAEAFYYIGELYGVRGDIALCQAVLETGWFRFMDGTPVKPEHFNFGGLGVTGDGSEHNIYDSMIEGVTALIQHLYAYACTDALPEDETLVDMRFKFVDRGCAPTWEGLSNRWAQNENYGRDIMRIFRQMQRSAKKTKK